MHLHRRGTKRNSEREGPIMTKKLTKHGHSLALVIERGVLDLLRIDEGPLWLFRPTGGSSSLRR